MTNTAIIGFGILSLLSQYLYSSLPFIQNTDSLNHLFIEETSFTIREGLFILEAFFGFLFVIFCIIKINNTNYITQDNYYNLRMVLSLALIVSIISFIAAKLIQAEIVTINSIYLAKSIVPFIIHYIPFLISALLIASFCCFYFNLNNTEITIKTKNFKLNEKDQKNML